MRDKEKDAAMMAAKRKNMLDVAYGLFSEKGIEPVTMADIARETGYGNTTLHRYFPNKPSLVIAVATEKWEEYTKLKFAERESEDWTHSVASEQFEYFLDSFIDLYENHRDLLRFNQFFNIYIRSTRVSGEELTPYRKMISALYLRFWNMYIKAKQDKTVRTDISDQQLFSATLHLMLATVTRYAIGLVYLPPEGVSQKDELLLMKKMLMNEFTLAEV